MATISNAINNQVGGSNSGVTNTFTTTNSSNTASSQAQVDINVGGSSAGDPYLSFGITGSNFYALGMDNSDNDYLKITQNTTAVTPSSSNIHLSIEPTGTTTSYIWGSSNAAGPNVLRIQNTNSPGQAILFVRGNGDETYLRISEQASRSYAFGINTSSSPPQALELRTASTDIATPSTGAQIMVVSTNAAETTWPSQPAFLARASGAQSNVTGDGTVYTVLFATAIYNQASDYNTGTSTFTAPVTGRYHFSTNVTCIGIGASHTSAQINLSTSNRSYLGTLNSAAAVRDNSNIATYQLSTYADMDAADIATVTITVANSTKTISINFSGTNTFFGGKLVA